MNSIVQRLAVRQVQIGAMFGVASLDPIHFKPVVAVFAPEVADNLQVSANADWSCVALTVTAADASDRVLSMLERVYQVSESGLAAVRTVAEQLGDGSIDFTVETRKDQSEPALRVKFATDSNETAAFEALVALGGLDAGSDFLQACRDLFAERWVGLAVHFDQPDAAPRFQFVFRWSVIAPERDMLADRLVVVQERLGVSEAQRTWFSQMLLAFASQDGAPVDVILEASPQELHKRLTLEYREIPSRLVLKLLTQFNPQPLQGARLGSLTAAAGIHEDVVSRLRLTAHDAEPPLVEFSLEVSDVDPTSV